MLCTSMFSFTVARTLELVATFESVKGFNIATFPDNMAKESVQTALANDVSITQNVVVNLTLLPDYLSGVHNC